MPADFAKARSRAVQLLLSSRLYGLRIDAAKLKYDKNIVFESFSSFCANSPATLADIENGGLRDGCTVRREAAGSVIYLVLYNDRVKSKKRRRFTLAHEVGHIILEHESDDAPREAEASCFAAELILPRILVYELKNRIGSNITACEIADVFGVSREVSENQIKSLGYDYNFSDNEKLLLKKLSGLLPDFSGPVIDS